MRKRVKGMCGGSSRVMRESAAAGISAAAKGALLLGQRAARLGRVAPLWGALRWLGRVAP
ncbi:hypothetical protein ABEX25_02775 [Paenibacillus thiaminolyticus]|uniref:hypothetical protein n=1 Tax=Paenibacillus thiaminolyticus TaxID=49283 RepID=UPI003D2CFF72